MSNRGAHPIVEIVGKRAIDMEIVHVLTKAGYAHDDEFTYTIRFTVPKARRDNLRQAIRQQCPEDAPRFLALMDANDWDVSFLVDGF